MNDITDLIALMIPLAPFALGALWIWTRHRQKELAIQTELSAQQAAQYARHTARLEERVRVLERIVTDHGFDVTAQIEALRGREGGDGSTSHAQTADERD